MNKNLVQNIESKLHYNTAIFVLLKHSNKKKSISFMGDLAGVSEFESALDKSKRSKRVCAMELSNALAMLGFGTWNALEPGRNALLSNKLAQYS